MLTKAVGEKKVSILIPELQKIFIDDKKALERDFSNKVTINKKTEQKYALRIRGSVRIVTGRYKTKDEYEQWRKKVLETPLP
jgi:hypothetical protein